MRLITVFLFTLLTVSCVLTGVDMTPEPTIDPALPQTAGIHQLVFDDMQRYTLSIPEGYDGSEAVPLVLALHYGGSVSPWYGRGVLEILVEPALRELRPIIVAPDAQHGTWASEAAEADVLALLDYIMVNYNIDGDRTLITGFSMGGMGTWYLAARNQERFTAAIPIAARPQSNTLTTEWQIPLYVIHSEADELIGIGPTETAVAQLEEQGADITFAAVPNLSHYATGQFASVLKEAVPWLAEVWQ